MQLLPKNEKRLAEGGRRLNGDIIQKDDSIPLISIVMVVYNGAKYIEEALTSVFEQSYKNIEFIVIDGGSTDNTVNIIKKYEEQIDYWVSEPDEGQSDAFNKGFSVCSGTLATWLNSDEILVPNCIEKVAVKIEKNPDIKWLSSGIIMTDAEKNIIRCRLGERGSNILSTFGILNVYGPSTFFSLDLFHKVGGMKKELHYTMDTDLWWRFKQDGVKLYRLNEYVYIYRLHEDSKTARYIVKNEPRNKEQTNENKRLCKKYMKCNQKVLKYVGKSFLIIFRLFSTNYIKSVIYSLRYQGQTVNALLKHLRLI